LTASLNKSNTEGKPHRLSLSLSLCLSLSLTHKHTHTHIASSPISVPHIWAPNVCVFARSHWPSPHVTDHMSIDY